MPDPYIPIFKAATVTSAGVSLSWAGDGRMGAAYVRNAGPDDIFLGWDAVPPAATIGDGRLRLIANEALNLDAIKMTSLGFRSAVGETAVVEAAALPRPGSSGTGIQ